MIPRMSRWQELRHDQSDRARRAGHQTTDERITVLNPERSVVTVQRGQARSTMFCTPNRCEASPVPGDQADRFDTITGQIDKREAQNLKSAATGQ
jgi:hypothetical protein